MAPYSIDLRERVMRAWDASGDADEVSLSSSGRGLPNESERVWRGQGVKAGVSAGPLARTRKRD
jgi:hypothetical protein